MQANPLLTLSNSKGADLQTSRQKMTIPGAPLQGDNSKEMVTDPLPFGSVLAQLNEVSKEPLPAAANSEAVIEIYSDADEKTPDQALSENNGPVRQKRAPADAAVQTSTITEPIQPIETADEGPSPASLEISKPAESAKEFVNDRPRPALNHTSDHKVADRRRSDEAPPHPKSQNGHTNLETAASIAKPPPEARHPFNSEQTEPTNSSVTPENREMSTVEKAARAVSVDGELKRQPVSDHPPKAGMEKPPSQIGQGANGVFLRGSKIEFYPQVTDKQEGRREPINLDAGVQSSTASPTVALSVKKADITLANTPVQSLPNVHPPSRKTPEKTISESTHALPDQQTKLTYSGFSQARSGHSAILSKQTTPQVMSPSFALRDAGGSLETDAFSLRTEAVQQQATLQTQFSPTRMDLPHHIARQIADVMQHMPSRPIEISLSPEELGRVRLAMTSSETGIMVNVLTERPETLDMMRRHISSLEAAFEEIGYRDISFSFSGGGGADNETADQASPKATQKLSLDADVSHPPDHITVSTGVTSGLDIRL